MKLTKAFPAGIALILTLAACTALPPKGTPALKAGNSTAALATAVPGRLPIQDAARNFAQVIARVEPIAESLCRSQPGLRNCDFQIWVDTDAELPPNAYQTLDQSGRPQIVFTLALIAEARNPDELAFVLGHETAHHIEGHLAETRQEATNAAIIGGLLASASGASDSAIERAQKIGAEIGALCFSKGHELEADRLGTLIAYQAGFDPVLGARFFARMPDPGDGFLGSHPGNAQRQAVVAQTYAEIATR